MGEQFALDQTRIGFFLTFDIGLGFNLSYDLVPLSSIMHQIFAFSDYGGAPSQFSVHYHGGLGGLF